MKYRSYLNGTGFLRPTGSEGNIFPTQLLFKCLSVHAFRCGDQQRSLDALQKLRTVPRITRFGMAVVALLYLVLPSLAIGQSLNSILSQAQKVKAPGSGHFKPDHDVHPFGTSNGNTSLAVRNGIVTLSNGTVLSGKVWTTLKTPFH